MNTLRATLATSAVLLVGLLVAGHVRYPNDAASEAAVRKVMEERLQAIAAETRAAEAETAAAKADTIKATWVDPPARIEDRTVPQPAKFTSAAASTAEAPPQASVEPPAQAVRQTADAAKKAEQARRRKLAQAARAKQAKAKEPAGAAEVAYQTQPAPAQRIDPIGDILRGLGIGRQG